MVNNHFIDDSLLSVHVNQESVDGALSYLDTSFVTPGIVVKKLDTN